MGKFIIAAVILFTLSAIPFCDGKTLPLKERERIVHAKIKEVCDEPTYQGFIKCESKPGKFKMDLFFVAALDVFLHCRN